MHDGFFSDEDLKHWLTFDICYVYDQFRIQRNEYQAYYRRGESWIPISVLPSPLHDIISCYNNSILIVIGCYDNNMHFDDLILDEHCNNLQ